MTAPTSLATARLASSTHESSRGALLVVAAAALFGTIGTARALGPDAPAASVGAVRLVIASALLLLLAAPAGLPALRAAWRRPAVWIAGAAQAAFNLTFFAAVTRTGVAVGTLVAIGCTPILTGLASRHLTRSWLLATGLALAGLATLLSEGFDADVTWTGLGFALGAAASYATFILSSAALTGSSAAGTRVNLAAIFTVAAAALAPALLLTSLNWVTAPSGLAMVAYLAVAATVGAYSLFNRGLESLRPGTAAMLGLTEPLVAAVLGVVVLGERLSAVSSLGAVVVLAGLLVMVRTTRLVPARTGPPM